MSKRGILVFGILAIILFSISFVSADGASGQLVTTCLAAEGANCNTNTPSDGSSTAISNTGSSALGF